MLNVFAENRTLGLAFGKVHCHFNSNPLPVTAGSESILMVAEEPAIYGVVSGLFVLQNLPILGAAVVVPLCSWT